MELWNLIHDRVRHQDSIFPIPSTFYGIEYSIPGRSYSTVPVGWYLIIGGPNVYLEMYTGTTWRRTQNAFAGVIKSDGMNVRLYNSSPLTSWFVMVPI